MIEKILAETTATTDESGGTALLGLVVLSALFYFLPSLIAILRRVRNLASVIVINLFLGWTLVGWVVALAMAVRTKDRQPG